MSENWKERPYNPTIISKNWKNELDPELSTIKTNLNDLESEIPHNKVNINSRINEIKSYIEELNFLLESKWLNKKLFEEITDNEINKYLEVIIWKINFIEFKIFETNNFNLKYDWEYPYIVYKDIVFNYPINKIDDLLKIINLLDFLIDWCQYWINLNKKINIIQNKDKSLTYNRKLLTPSGVLKMMEIDYKIDEIDERWLEQNIYNFIDEVKEFLEKIFENHLEKKD